MGTALKIKYPATTQSVKILGLYYFVNLIMISSKDNINLNVWNVWIESYVFRVKTKDVKNSDWLIRSTFIYSGHVQPFVPLFNGGNLS